MTDFTYAWKARGGGYSNAVGESAAKRFDALVEEGRKLLQSAGADAALDPGYQMIRVQLSGSSCDHVDEIGMVIERPPRTTRLRAATLSASPRSPTISSSADALTM